MKLYSDVRLGISLGYTKGITLEELDTLFVGILPATLTLVSSKSTRPENEEERDRARASFIKDALN